MKLTLLYASVLYLFSSLVWEIGQAATVCPPMPDKITQVNRDVRSDIQGSVGSLGKFKAGEVATKTEVVAKNLFEKYPNVDKVLITQMMAATYCSMIRDSISLTEKEKQERWEKFQERVFAFLDPNYPPREPSNKEPPKNQPQRQVKTLKSHPPQPSKVDPREVASNVQGPSQPSKPIVPPASTGQQPAGPSSPQEAPIQKASLPPIPPKDFGSLLVRMSSLDVMSDNSVVVSLTVLNKTDKDIVAALDTYQLNIRMQKSGVFIIDESGNRYELKESSGIGEKAFSEQQGGDKSGKWLICPPGIDMTVSLTFAPSRNMEKRGNTFSTTIPIVVGRFYKDNWGGNKFELRSRFNISFSKVYPA